MYNYNIHFFSLFLQMVRLNRRLTNLERQQDVQANREKAIVVSALGYVVLKFVMWFFRSK